MTVEDQRDNLMGEDGVTDSFPVGMRVLAVDDNPICLKLLENLLQRCQYHVTTTNQPIQALKMLRENQNKFDLVISDVDMPDMDGFKLLELVGLEMDLPVIMLSAHSDTKLVMKGITHGACDYLLKPVRIEELKNIWQHVIRKKKPDSRKQDSFPNQDKDHHRTGEGEQGFSLAGNSDNGKLRRKRTNQNEVEEDEGEENESDNEDPSSQKKPRVVWSVELHRKFVSAVNQLGLEKAVPKKILDMMNVEGLSRENVASHLQKYRLYLKRISTVATQQVNFVASLGGKDASYMRMSALDGFGLVGSGRLANKILSTYAPGGMLGRLNSPTGLGLQGISSSGVIQQGPPPNSNNSIDTIGKLQPALLATNQIAGLFQGTPTSLELNQLHQFKSMAREFNPINDLSGFNVASGFPDTRVTVGNSFNSISSTSTNANPLILQGSIQQMHGRGDLGSQSALRIPSLNSESFQSGLSHSSSFIDYDRCNESWQHGIQLSKFPFPPTSLASSDTYPCTQFLSNNSSISTACPDTGHIPVDFPSRSTVPNPLQDSIADIQCQEELIGNVFETTNYTRRQNWEEQKQTYNQNLSHSSISSLISPSDMVGPLSQRLDQKNAVCNDYEKNNVSMIGQLNSSMPFFGQHAAVERPIVETRTNLHGNDPLDQTTAHNGYTQRSYDSPDNIMNVMVKQEQNEQMLMDGEFRFDAYSLGPCI